MQADAFAASFDEAVERSFRNDAIRTAILIDDQFPDYIQMQDAKIADFRDLERAKSLYSFLHRRGLLCDVLNWRKPEDADPELVDKVRKSDLVVLDFQLGPGGPKTALKILRHLAESPHFNLVVLYTSDPLNTASLAAAGAMRGLKPLAAQLTVSPEVLDEAVVPLKEFDDIDAAALTAYIKDGTTAWQTPLRLAMTAEGISLQHLAKLTQHVARRWLARLFDGYQPESTILDLRCSITGDGPRWIQSGSCFVAVVKKGAAPQGQDEGTYVWECLGRALRAWRPNMYRLILSEIQNALELEAIADHETWLDDNLCLGLGLYLLEDDEAARGERAAGDIAGTSQSLIDRFVDLIRRRLANHDTIARTAATLLNGRLQLPLPNDAAKEGPRRVRARELAHVGPTEVIDWEGSVLPAVNAFMVSDDFRGGHITTGTVLRDERANHWLTVSPACDLVPRADGPILVQLMRLSKIKTADRYTIGDKVALHADGEVQLFRALQEVNRQPTLKTLYLPNGTRVDGEGGDSTHVLGWFADLSGVAKALGDAKAGKASASKDAAARSNESQVAAEPALAKPSPFAASALGPTEMAKFTVVSQLRSSFATRFLLVSGQHQSRIGVDFVDLRDISSSEESGAE
jgi:hypothetical protein